MNDLRGQYDFDDLSAYLDGELEPARKAEVEKLLREDSSWQAAYAELKALDGILSAWQSPEAPDRLAERIATAARQCGSKRQVIRLARIIGPIAAAAAAAAIFVAVLINNQPQQTNMADPSNGTAKISIEELDEVVVENLEFFRDYEILTNFETLEAIERLEIETQI